MRMMRTNAAVVLTAAVAVVAHKPIALFGPAKSPERRRDTGPAHVGAVLATAAVLVIDSEKAWVCLAAADTLSAIRLNHQGAVLDISQAVTLQNRRLVLVIMVLGALSDALSGLPLHAHAILSLTRGKEFQIRLPLFLSSRLLPIFATEVNLVKALFLSLDLLGGEQLTSFHSRMLTHLELAINETASRYRRAQQYAAGPYLEMFSREHRPGWDAWGLEVGKFDQKEAA